MDSNGYLRQKTRYPAVNKMVVSLWFQLQSIISVKRGSPRNFLQINWDSSVTIVTSVWAGRLGSIPGRDTAPFT
jgi:hypothetical protein